MAWAKNGTPDTLGSAGDTNEITDLAGVKFNTFLQHRIATGGNVVSKMRFNSVSTGTPYTSRENADGGTDTTDVSSNNIYTGSVDNVNGFLMGYFIGIATEEKLIMTWLVRNTTAGAATAPNRQETVGKWAETSSTITALNLFNDQAGSYDTSTNLSALGTD